MIPTPTDRLHKLAALGGLALAVAGAGAALHQYNLTALQDAELYEHTMRSVYAYNRFAEVARQRIKLSEELDKGIATSDRQAEIKHQLRALLEKIQPLDREVQEALIQSEKHASIAKHHHRLQTFWAGACLYSNGFVASLFAITNTQVTDKSQKTNLMPPQVWNTVHLYTTPARAGTTVFPTLLPRRSTP